MGRSDGPLTAEEIAAFREYLDRGRRMGFPHASEEKILRLLDEVECNRALICEVSAKLNTGDLPSELHDRLEAAAWGRT